MTPASTLLTHHLGIKYPIIGGPMYPCSNPELVAAISNAGAIGVIQPLTLTYVFNYDLREGIRYIRSLTSQPIGFNALIEASSSTYLQRVKKWVAIALEEQVSFFITSLGKPNWVVEAAHKNGAKVYHDVTEKKWAEIALAHGVDGLICVNHRAGGHAGTKSAMQLYEALCSFNVPLICAGGIGNATDYHQALALGYAGVQMGTRFIATHECSASEPYKQAILHARASDIVLTEKVTGVPLSIIRTSHVEKMGTHTSGFAKWMLKHRYFKRIMRLFYSLRSIIQLKRASLAGYRSKDFWQAGKSVENIHQILTVEEVIQSFVGRENR